MFASLPQMLASRLPPFTYIEGLLALSMLLLLVGLSLASIGSRFTKRVLALSAALFLLPIAITVIKPNEK